MSGIVGHRGLLLAGVSPPASGTVISMDFEANYTDTGSAGSSWSAGGSGVSIDTSAPLVGAGSLSISDPSGYLRASATADNMLPVSGDWELSCRALASSWSNAYLFSVQDSTPTAAGTQFAIACDAVSRAVVVLSNGTTRSQVIAPATATTLPTGSAFDLAVGRSGTTIYLKINGTTVASATYASTLAQPAGQSWRIGHSVYASGGAAPAFKLDTLRLVK